VVHLHGSLRHLLDENCHGAVHELSLGRERVLLLDLVVQVLNALLPQHVQLLQVHVRALLNLVRQDLHVEEDLDALDQSLSILVIKGLLELG